MRYAQAKVQSPPKEASFASEDFNCDDASVYLAIQWAMECLHPMDMQDEAVKDLLREMFRAWSERSKEREPKSEETIALAAGA